MLMSPCSHTISTVLQRTDGVVDVVITFTASGYQRASRAFWDEPGYPEHFEDIAFVGAAFDLPGGCEPDADTLTDLGGPIADAEVLVLREWLADHGDEASEIAVKALQAEDSL